MKLYLYTTLLLLALLGCNSDAKDEVLYVGNEKIEVIEISNTRYRVVTSKTEVENGLIYYKLQVEDKDRPVIAHALELDPTISNLKLESFLAGNTLSDVASPVTISQENSTSSKDVVALINADFFNMGTDNLPLGGVMRNGRVLKTPNSDWTHLFGFDQENNPYSGNLILDATITLANGHVANFDVLNNSRLANTLVLYDSYRGEITGTNPWGLEFLLKPIDGVWDSLTDYTNVKCKIVGVRAEGADTPMELKKGHLAISAHGTMQGILSNNGVAVGDEVTISVNGFTTAGGVPILATNMLGFQSKVLDDGTVRTPDGDSEFAQRSAIGYSRYTKKIYLLAIEGRSETSSGTKIGGVGDIMKYIGASDAVNLDGGGSTCLILNGKIVNELVDGNIRPIPNAWGMVRNK